MSDDRFRWDPGDVVMIDNVLPTGYDPDKLQDVVQDAKADADSNSTKAVLAEMRRQNPDMK